MLAEIFEKNGIFNYSALPLSACKITKPYLLKNLSENSYVIFAVIPYYCGKASNLSAFAAVPDYHRFAKQIFDEAAQYIACKYGRSAAGFADHSPFSEVECAALCGLGIIGDNGLLITPEYSSFVCIGDLVCELDKEQLISEGISVLDEPLPIGRCEHCGACQKACPTKALNGNKSLCLSAISQKKADLSSEEAELFAKSNCVWGCDECQLACPHTKRAAEAGTITTPVSYFLTDHIEKMTPAKLASMSDAEYSSYTFSWRSREVMLRNLKMKGVSDD